MTDSAFRPPPQNLALKSNEIHIWRANLDQEPNIIQRLADTLSADEQKKAQDFHFINDEKRFTAGRGILRAVLAHYIGVEPKRIQFYYGLNGKPLIAQHIRREKRIYFNVSHSEGYALYAFTYDREIGVDIEYKKNFSEMDGVAKRFFTKEENTILQTLSKIKKIETFFNFWTRKEACAKAVGVGLSRTFEQIDVSSYPCSASVETRGEDGSRRETQWSIQDLNPLPGFAAAVAVEGKDCPLNCWQWSTLLDSSSLYIQSLNQIPHH